MIKNSYTISIEATLDEVWNKLLNVSKWSDWHSTLSNIIVPDLDIKEGTKFSYQYDKTKLKAEIISIQPQKVFRFKATAMGVTGVNTWTLEQKNGYVQVTDYEEMRGLIVFLFKKSFQKGLEEGMKKWLDNFQKSFEK